MILTRVKNVSAFFVLGCLISCLPALCNTQTDDKTTLRNVVGQFFTAFQKKDFPGVMALWTAQPPDLAAGRQIIQQAFARYRTIEVKNLSLNKITLETNKASVQVSGWLNVVSAQTGASATTLQMNWTIELAKETGAWKILRYVTREDELAEALSAAGTPEEQAALLNAQSGLVSLELVFALNKQARQLLARSKQSEAVMISDLALELGQRLNDKRGMFLALRLKGTVARVRGDNQQALE